MCIAPAIDLGVVAPVPGAPPKISHSASSTPTSSRCKLAGALFFRDAKSTLYTDDVDEAEEEEHARFADGSRPSVSDSLDESSNPERFDRMRRLAGRMPATGMMTR
jgi:hypothetical protein